MAKSSSATSDVHPDIKKLEKAKAEALSAFAEFEAAREKLDVCRQNAGRAKVAYLEARKAAAHTVLGEELHFDQLHL